MIIVFKPQATEQDIDHVTDRLRELGLKSQISQGEERTIIGVIGDERLLDNQPLSVFPGVESVTPIMAPWKLVSREFQKQNTVIDVGNVQIGGNRLVVMAGPCAVEKLEITVASSRKSKPPGDVYYGVERISRGPPPIPSKAWAVKASTFWPKPRNKPDFPSSVKFSIPATLIYF